VTRDVRVVEVLLRDGLQTMVHERDFHVPSTAEKIDLAGRLADAGVPEIEVTGFVHPRVIPMLADASDVIAGLAPRPGTVFRALVPNVKGADRARAAGCTKLSALIVASETYSGKNSNMSVRENVEQIRRIAALARESDLAVNVTMGIAFLCPYEGLVPERRVLELIDEFAGMGVEEISIADSIGMANPRLIAQRFASVHRRWPELTLGAHLHERTGMAIANVVAAYESGATVIESCIGGYGGGISMPTSVLGMGNVPTEDVVNLFAEMGIETGIDLAAVRRIGEDVAELLRLESGSRVTRFGTFADFHAEAQAHRADAGRSGVPSGPETR
jgi:hydroxymethylglutaryl-CoA lyase